MSPNRVLLQSVANFNTVFPKRQKSQSQTGAMPSGIGLGGMCPSRSSPASHSSSLCCLCADIVEPGLARNELAFPEYHRVTKITDSRTT